MITLKMEKETLHSDPENNCEDCSPERMGVTRGNVYCLGSFWGQLILMGILTLLFWLCLFSIAGYVPSKGLSSGPVVCNSLDQDAQVPLVQPEPDSASTNFLFFGYILTAIMGEDKASTEDPLLSSDNEVGVILTSPDFDVADVSLNAQNADESSILPLPAPSPALQSEDDISILFDIITESLTDSDMTLSKYYISSEDQRLNWFEALQACALNGLQLVAIQTEEKNNEIKQRIEEELGLADGDFWTSGTDLWTNSRDKYYWASTSKPVEYTDWHMNNPNAPNDQNCIQITNVLDSLTKDNLHWNDYACEFKSRFICEKIE